MSIEAMKLALEALDCICSPLHVREIEKIGNAMKAIREALAQPEQESDDLTIAYMSGFHDGKNKYAPQPEQEPVAMRYDFDGYGWLYIDNGSGSNWKEKIKNAEPLYTTPPQRKPLTDEQIEKIIVANLETWNSKSAMASFVRAIESAHGIKGE